MSNYQQNQVPAHFVNVKRVKQETDTKGRERTVLTFGLTKGKNGEENSLDTLLEVLSQYKGRQVNLDIRIEEKADQNGRKFPSAFVRVTEMIPKNAVGKDQTFTPKTNSRQANVKANAEKIRNSFEG